MNIFKKIKIKIIRRHIRKKRIFFEETKLTKLPSNNFVTHDNDLISYLKSECIELKNNRISPGSVTCNLLVPLIKNLDKNIINFLDIGAGSFRNYFSLINNFKNLNYFYYDLPEISKIIKRCVQEENLTKIYVFDFQNIVEKNFDFIFLGSSIQYIPNYEKFIKTLLKLNPNFILFSALPCFSSNSEDRDFFVIKQLNLYPDINYLYQINIDKFKKIFFDNNYNEIFTLENHSQPFINFNNFKNKKIDSKYLDILFKKDSI